MSYITKSVDVDVEVELEDVLEFIESASKKERDAIAKAIGGERIAPEAPFLIPVFMQGHSSQLIAIGRLEEILNQIGVEDAVALLAR